MKGDAYMKSTGIVRRIDDLGRIVIPKEIRNTLHIRNGNTLEIFTDSQGGVIFKKYSPVGELSAFAQQYADVLTEYIKLPLLVCDCDRVVAVGGVSRKEYLERRITSELEDCMRDCKKYISTGKSEFMPVDGVERPASIICPIVASSNVVGTVVLLQNVNEKAPDPTEITLVQVAASFLGMQMEE